MFTVFAVLVLMMSFSFAEVGHVLKVAGNPGYILRGSEKISLAKDVPLEVNDELHSDESVIVIYLQPSSQLSLAKHTDLKISKNLIESQEDTDESFSIIDFVKGMIRVQVTKDEGLKIDQKINCSGVAFSVRGTEFEVSQGEGDDIDLDVIEGEVEATSEYVKTFVPEIIKADQGFQFSKKERKFARRQMRLKFKDHPAFLARQEIRNQWRMIRAQRKAQRLQNREAKKEARLERKAERESLRTERKNLRMQKKRH